MIKSPAFVAHVQKVLEGNAEKCVARVSVRVGEVQVGQSLSFESVDRRKIKLRVAQARPLRSSLELELEGNGCECLESGTYLLGDIVS